LYASSSGERCGRDSRCGRGSRTRDFAFGLRLCLTRLGINSSYENLTKIKSDQVDTSPLSVQDSMLCSLGQTHEKSTATGSQNATPKKTQNLDNTRNASTSSQNGKSASLCASSKRKLDAYRARPLEPKEGELANENNEMFEEILQSKLPRKV
jgi:hypothetical protein